MTRAGHLRRPASENARVTSVELFFDLVYVFTITQLSGFLRTHLNAAGALKTGLLLIMVWHVWVYTTWTTNWLDPDRKPVRLLLLGLMPASLVGSSEAAGLGVLSQSRRHQTLRARVRA